MPHAEIIINEDYPGINPTSFGYQNCTASHSYGPAVRTHWLLHYVVSGCGIFRRDGQEYQLSAGDIFVIPPFLETYYEADDQQPWHYIWVGFTSSVPLPSPFEQPVLRCPGIGKVFEDMHRCQQLQAGKSAFLASRIWELLSLVLEEGKAENDYVEKAIHCMQAEYMTDLTVAGLAERLNLDRCYFSTLFTRQVGTSPLPVSDAPEIGKGCGAYALPQPIPFRSRRFRGLFGYLQFLQDVQKEIRLRSPAIYSGKPQVSQSQS